MLTNQHLDVYHGTPRNFDVFSLEFLGQGHDEEGPGIYLTTDKTDAERYATGPTGRVLAVKARFRRLVSTQSPAKRSQIEQAVKRAPRLDLHLADWDEDPAVALRTAVTMIASGATEHDAFQSVWADFYRHDEAAYLETMKALGFDGVEIDCSEGVRHLVMFSPSDLTVTEVLRPAVKPATP